MFLTCTHKKRDAHNRKQGGQKETRRDTFRPSLSLSAACAAAATRGAAPFEKAEEAEELASCDFIISSALSK